MESSQANWTWHTQVICPSCTCYPMSPWACDHGGKEPWGEETGFSYIPEPMKTQEMIPRGGIPWPNGALGATSGLSTP